MSAMSSGIHCSHTSHHMIISQVTWSGLDHWTWTPCTCTLHGTLAVHGHGSWLWPCARWSGQLGSDFSAGRPQAAAVRLTARGGAATSSIAGSGAEAPRRLSGPANGRTWACRHQVMSMAGAL